MLTSAQVATEAYATEDGELLCPDCFDRGDIFARPVSQYELSEWQTSASEGWDESNAEANGVDPDSGRTYDLMGDGVWHQRDCGCEPELYDENGHELMDAFVDWGCDKVNVNDLMPEGVDTQLPLERLLEVIEEWRDEHSMNTTTQLREQNHLRLRTWAQARAEALGLR